MASLAAATAAGAQVDASAVAARIRYEEFADETQLPAIVALIEKDLSEPYSIYTYRYFIHGWPKLCVLAKDGDETVGVVVCKCDRGNRKQNYRGYIAMLAVKDGYRRCRIATTLVSRAIANLKEAGCDEAVLETELTNSSALNLYGNLGFVRDKRMIRYYLNGVDAFRLKLWLRAPGTNSSTEQPTEIISNSVPTENDSRQVQVAESAY